MRVHPPGEQSRPDLARKRERTPCFTFVATPSLRVFKGRLDVRAFPKNLAPVSRLFRAKLNTPV